MSCGFNRGIPVLHLKKKQLLWLQMCPICPDILKHIWVSQKKDFVSKAKLLNQTVSIALPTFLITIISIIWIKDLNVIAHHHYLCVPGIKFKCCSVHSVDNVSHVLALCQHGHVSSRAVTPTSLQLLLSWTKTAVPLNQCQNTVRVITVFSHGAFQKNLDATWSDEQLLQRV